MAERLVHACRLYATIRLRYEHREWVERTIALETDERQPQSATLAQAAFWAAADGGGHGLDRARFLHRALQLAAPFDDPRAAPALTHTSPGDDDLMPDPLAALELVTAKMDLDREW